MVLASEVVQSECSISHKFLNPAYIEALLTLIQVEASMRAIATSM